MSETKHTPGPWVVVPDGESAYRIRSEDWGGVAYLHNPVARELGCLERLAADARLIAESPEMEAALRDVIAPYEGLSDVSPLTLRIRDILARIDAQ